MGSFIFLGPSGVGKTTFKALAEFLSAPRMPHQLRHVRVHGKAQVSRLIGSPPGYVGYDEGGPAHQGRTPEAVFRRALRRDREGASDVFNVLLQILEEGHLTDGQGRKVDFRNTIIIMTSNVGAARSRVRTRSVSRRRTRAVSPTRRFTIRSCPSSRSCSAPSS